MSNILTEIKSTINIEDCLIGEYAADSSKTKFGDLIVFNYQPSDTNSPKIGYYAGYRRGKNFYNKGPFDPKLTNKDNEYHVFAKKELIPADRWQYDAGETHTSEYTVTKGQKTKWLKVFGQDLIIVKESWYNSNSQDINLGFNYIEDQTGLGRVNFSGSLKEAISELILHSDDRISEIAITLSSPNLIKSLSYVDELGLIFTYYHKGETYILNIPKNRVLHNLKSEYDRLGDYIKDVGSNKSYTNQSITGLTKYIEMVSPSQIIKKITINMFKDHEIGQFADLLMGRLNKMNKVDLRVVEGDEITYWYHEDNYYPNNSKGSTLSKSCMRGEAQQHQARLYSVIDDLKMVILLKDNKLIARALLWTLSTGEKYLDRIYYHDQKGYSAILNWAIEQGITLRYDLYKKSMNHDWTIDRNLYVNFDYFKIVNTYGKDITFPYFDSFSCILGNLKQLTINENKDRESLENPMFTLPLIHINQESDDILPTRWLPDDYISIDGGMYKYPVKRDVILQYIKDNKLDMKDLLEFSDQCLFIDLHGEKHNKSYMDMYKTILKTFNPPYFDPITSYKKSITDQREEYFSKEFHSRITTTKRWNDSVKPKEDSTQDRIYIGAVVNNVGSITAVYIPGNIQISGDFNRLLLEKASERSDNLGYNTYTFTPQELQEIIGGVDLTNLPGDRVTNTQQALQNIEQELEDLPF